LCIDLIHAARVKEITGGPTYFLLGVPGLELIHVTHWLGALAIIKNVIGRIETRTHCLFEAAADFVPSRRISFTSVVTRDHGRPRALLIYVPQLTSLSETHGTLIKRYGYAPPEKTRELVSRSRT